MLVDGLPAQTIQAYAEKTYQNKDIATFALLCGSLSTESQAAFLAQAQKDKQIAFVSVLEDEMTY